MKRCAKCLVVKHCDDFYRNNSTPDGFRSDCKQCHKIVNDKCYRNRINKQVNSPAIINITININNHQPVINPSHEQFRQ